jgi:hypothetical protein
VIQSMWPASLPENQIPEQCQAPVPATADSWLPTWLTCAKRNSSRLAKFNISVTIGAGRVE